MITFLHIDECVGRLEASFEQNYRQILNRETSAEIPRPRKFFIGRTLTQSQFEIRIIVADSTSRQPGKTFFGYLQSFSTGTKIQGELRYPTGEKVSKWVIVLIILFMLLFSLIRLADNVGVIAGLIGILLVAAILE